MSTINSTAFHAISDHVEEYNTTTDSNVLSAEDIVYYTLYTYALLQKRRSLTHNTVISMSREEYQQHKPREFPSWWVLSRAAGGWSYIQQILPIEHNYRTARNRRGDDATISSFYHLLGDIAHYYNEDIDDVSIRQFQKYSSQHPHMNIPDWRVYTGYISSENTWRDAKNITISTMNKVND